MSALIPLGRALALATAALVMAFAVVAPSGPAWAGEPAPGADVAPTRAGTDEDATETSSAPDTDESQPPDTDESETPDTGESQTPDGEQDATSTQPTSPSAAPTPSVDPDVLAEQRARELAAAEQRAREAAAEAQARAQAAAERRAAQLAAAGRRAQVSWEGHGRPRKLIIVRERSIDLVTDGRLTRQVPRAGGALRLTTLDRFVPDDWLVVDGALATLGAAVVLSPAQSLTLGGDVRTVHLTGGPTAPDAAAIYTGRGRLALSGVTVDSLDPTTSAAMPVGPGRPFLVVSSGGRLDAVDSQVTDLGTDPAEPAPRAGLTLGETSSGSLVRTTFHRNGIALKLDRTQDVRLDDVTVADSTADGLVLRGDRATTMIGVKAEGNGGNGVVVTGPSSDRPVRGISASGNTLFGLALVGQDAAQVRGIVTDGNRAGGVRVSWSTDVAISDLASTADTIGLYTHVGSTRITVDRAIITGSRRAMHVEKTTRGLTVRASTINAASITGISVGGHEIVLDDVAVTGSAAAVRVETGAGEVTADGLRINGGQRGIVALPATRNVVLRRVGFTGVGQTALRSFSPYLVVVDSAITGSATGIDAGAATLVSRVTIDEVDQGIRARSSGVIDLDELDISAFSVGVNVASGTPVRLARSHIDALESVRGELTQDGPNDLSLPPLNLLGTIGIPLILLALLLEWVDVVRNRDSERPVRRTPPDLTVTASMFSWDRRESHASALLDADADSGRTGSAGQTPAGARRIRGLSHLRRRRPDHDPAVPAGAGRASTKQD
jgi:hypothetical protein